MGIAKAVHVWARDGFSSKIVRHATMAMKNNLRMYEKVYIPVGSLTSNERLLNVYTGPVDVQKGQSMDV